MLNYKKLSQLFCILLALFLFISISSKTAQAGSRDRDLFKIKKSVHPIGATYSLKVEISGLGQVKGNRKSGKIKCSREKDGKYAGICDAKINEGKSFVLKAKPSKGYKIIGWSGNCEITPEIQPTKDLNPKKCAVTMNGDKTVSADFVLISPPPPPPLLPPHPLPPSPVSKEIPFGISNPYSQKDLDIKAKLPEVLKDLGLSKDENGVAGFIVDEIARKHTEETATCSDTACSGYDFSEARDLIDLVVGQGKANLWAVIGAPSNYKFTDGKIREDGKTYLPDGQISRQAYKGYLTEMVSFVNSYGKKISGNSDWYITQWNLYNEVNAEYRDTFGSLSDATEAYANFVVDSAEVLRRLSPQSKIVLAGAGSGTDLLDKHGEFYRLVFSKLKQSKLAYEPFDYWESHWFGKINNYKTNTASGGGYGAKDFIQFLKDNGYGDKEFVIRAGGTYSGQDTQERKHLMDNYQSEQQQAEFLIKRFVYNLAQGVKKIPWSTIYERDKYQGETHVNFQYVSLIYDGYPDGVSKKQKCADVDIKGMLPCPDPGMGVKKLSYYSYKKLIEVLKGSDWNNIQIIQEKDGVYVYKFIKNGKPIWAAWNDNATEKQITIFGINSSQANVTKAIPKYKTGKEVLNYNTAFNVETKPVSNGKITITLSDIPVFVEEK